MIMLDNDEFPKYWRENSLLMLISKFVFPSFTFFFLLKYYNNAKNDLFNFFLYSQNEKEANPPKSHSENSNDQIPHMQNKSVEQLDENQNND